MKAKETSVSSCVVTDPEMLAEVIRGARIAPLQIGNRPSASSLARVVCPNSCLELVTLGPAMLFTGAMPVDCFTFTYVMTCPGTGRSFNFSTNHTDGYMGFFPPGGALDAYTPAGLSDAILTVRAGAFRKALGVYFPEVSEDLLSNGAAMRVGDSEQRLLRQTIAAVSEAIRDTDQPLACEAARLQLERDLLFTFITALRSGCHEIVPPPKMRMARRYARFRRAREFVRDHVGEELHVDDLAEDLHLSERGIECLFHEMLGMPPSAFIRQQRLHCAHHALLEASPRFGGVKEVALTWGFWHLGHFSHDYRELFGESPGDTLAKQPVGRPDQNRLMGTSGETAPCQQQPCHPGRCHG